MHAKTLQQFTHLLLVENTLYIRLAIYATSVMTFGDSQQCELNVCWNSVYLQFQRKVGSTSFAVYILDYHDVCH
jgi:hypothetical protein